MQLMENSFDLQSISDRLSSHIGNFDYFHNKNLFVVPSFCAAKLGVQIP